MYNITDDPQRVVPRSFATHSFLPPRTPNPPSRTRGYTPRDRPLEKIPMIEELISEFFLAFDRFKLNSYPQKMDRWPHEAEREVFIFLLRPFNRLVSSCVDDTSILRESSKNEKK